MMKKYLQDSVNLSLHEGYILAGMAISGAISLLLLIDKDQRFMRSSNTRIKLIRRYEKIGAEYMQIEKELKNNGEDTTFIKKRILANDILIDAYKNSLNLGMRYHSLYIKATDKQEKNKVYKQYKLELGDMMKEYNKKIEKLDM
jgi:hypothetical protein